MDESGWNHGYHETAFDVVEKPDSFIYRAVKDLVDQSLDWLIRRQDEDGAWHLTFRFGKDEAFRRLEANFEAHYTMLTLAKLNRFGRIDK